MNDESTQQVCVGKPIKRNAQKAIARFCDERLKKLYLNGVST